MVPPGFYLSTGTPLQLTALPDSPAERWMQIPHTRIVRPAYVLLAGEELTLDTAYVLTSFSELFLRIGAAHPDLSTDGASLGIDLLDAEGSPIPVGELHVPTGQSGLQPRSVAIDMRPHAGMRLRLRLRCGPGPAGDPAGDWLAVFDLVACSSERRAHTRALAFSRERTANELGQFEHAYEHPIYQNANRRVGHEPRADAKAIPLQALRDAVPRGLMEVDSEPLIAEFPSPVDMQPPPAAAYEYAEHLLRAALPSKRPDFEGRWKTLGASRPLKVLSLCSGAGRVEANLAATAASDGVQVDWTLLDINEDLLLTAAGKFQGEPPSLIQADINEICDFGERYDVIMCVSALHHVVELEAVLRFIWQALEPGGEFWSIGEAIGRNGNRLWEGDYQAANMFFRSLPERYRRNAGTGTCDVNLPDVDCSDASFEGIRSEEILPLLVTTFEPVQTCLYNCFLWRLTNQAYSANYDLARTEDVNLLKQAVRAELRHFEAGGRPASLHGIFRKRPRTRALSMGSVIVTG